MSRATRSRTADGWRYVSASTLTKTGVSTHASPVLCACARPSRRSVTTCRPTPSCAAARRASSTVSSVEPLSTSRTAQRAVVVLGREVGEADDSGLGLVAGRHHDRDRRGRVHDLERGRIVEDHTDARERGEERGDVDDEHRHHHRDRPRHQARDAAQERDRHDDREQQPQPGTTERDEELALHGDVAAGRRQPDEVGDRSQRRQRVRRAGAELAAVGVDRRPGGPPPTPGSRARAAAAASAGGPSSGAVVIKPCIGGTDRKT